MIMTILLGKVGIFYLVSCETLEVGTMTQGADKESAIENPNLCLRNR
jgi:hypothetical protein